MSIRRSQNQQQYLLLENFQCYSWIVFISDWISYNAHNTQMARFHRSFDLQSLDTSHPTKTLHCQSTIWHISLQTHWASHPLCPNVKETLAFTVHTYIDFKSLINLRRENIACLARPLPCAIRLRAQTLHTSISRPNDVWTRSIFQNCRWMFNRKKLKSTLWKVPQHIKCIFLWIISQACITVCVLYEHISHRHVLFENNWTTNALCGWRFSGGPGLCFIKPTEIVPMVVLWDDNHCANSRGRQASAVWWCNHCLC